MLWVGKVGAKKKFYPTWYVKVENFLEDFYKVEQHRCANYRGKESKNINKMVKEWFI